MILTNEATHEPEIATFLGELFAEFDADEITARLNLLVEDAAEVFGEQEAAGARDPEETWEIERQATQLRRDVNNSGAREQVRFLLRQGFSFDQVRSDLETRGLPEAPGQFGL